MIESIMLFYGLSILFSFLVLGPAIIDGDIRWENVVFWPIWLSVKFLKYLKNCWRDI